MKSNIDKSLRKMENREEISKVYVDGDSTEAILRAIVDGEFESDEFEQFVENELGATVVREKFVGFGQEVTVK